MRSINRRQVVAGLTAGLGYSHLSSVFGLAPSKLRDYDILPSEGIVAKTYLSPMLTPEFLANNLISASDWHPYPKAAERESWQGVPQDVREAIVKHGEAILGTPWPTLPATLFLEFKENGNRTDYERLFFMRRQRLSELVLAECMEGKGRFLHEIANGVWLICEESFWGLPAHLTAQKAGVGLPDVTEPIIDLFGAETAATLAWTRYLVGQGLDKVSPLINKRIQMEANRRILDPGLSRIDFAWMGLSGSRHRLNNWTPWINSSWLETNLLLEMDPARRLAATSKICSSLDRFLTDYSVDGGCEEGPGYWQVSSGSYFDCCSALMSATGGKKDLLSNPFVRRMGHYIVDVHIAGHYYVNYGDAHAKLDQSPELLYRFGTATGDRALKAFGAFNAAESVSPNGQGRLARETPNVLTVAKARNSPKADALGRSAWYPALGLMTTREKVDSDEGFYLAVQAARNNRSHGHCDSGSFIIFHDGTPVFIDVGVEAYTAKTFGPNRYSIWTMQSAYHNLPAVNGVMQQGDDDRYRASDLHYVCDDAQTGLSMDLATAYPATAGVRRWLRSITLERNTQRIRLRENFQLEDDKPVTLTFMTPRKPTMSSQGSISLGMPDKRTADVHLIFDSALVKPSIETIALVDEGLQRTWGAEIYRILFTTVAPIERGNWLFEFHA
ncbi:heparinase II/III family protein [Edaphobacter paludis]|uniref:Heparinase II/III family protein n=1 Tax=Edaphobacter paludis TaxID=3035702 RepID=A0AAU7D9Q7_9BACT